MQSPGFEFADEGGMAIGPERMTGTETVARQSLADDNPQVGIVHCAKSLAQPAEAVIANRGRLPHNARPRTSQLTVRKIRSMAQYIYTMNRVSKVVPPKRVILRDISLSFFPGAKIGVLGLNGSGKSSLLRIMAGLDTSIDGEARPQSGIRVGYLPQEPELDPTKTVRVTVMEGVGETFRHLERFNEISDKFAEPMSDEEMTALLEEQAKLQDA